MEPEEDQFFHQHHKLSKSSSTTDSLPPELVTLILLRLPVKSLLKFRSVSKSWLASISSPQFINNHLSISTDNDDCTSYRLVFAQQNYLSRNAYQYFFKNGSVSSFFSNFVIEEYDLDHPLNDPGPRVWFVGSVNGLICIAVGSTDIVIWNPTIRKSKKFPNPRTTLAKLDLPIIGFGYDDFQDDYKVVSIFNAESSYPVEVHLYSLNSDSWKIIDGCPSNGLLSVLGKFVNGKLYWIATSDNLNECESWHIISFDLANEKWGKVEMLSYEKGSLPSVGALGSDLVVFSDIVGSHADVWVMKEWGTVRSWKKMYTIKYPVDLEYGSLIDVCSPTLCMSNKGEILILARFTCMIYNPEDGSIRYKTSPKYRPHIASNIYVESLVCPLLQNKPSTHQQRRLHKLNRMDEVKS